MGDHTHGTGEMMLSYRYMYMLMDGLRDGTESIEPADVVAADGYGFRVSPTRMPMHMHMIGLMWAPTGDLTLMGMVPFHKSDMDHVTRAGSAFTTSSSGVGDIKLVALYTVARPDRQRLILQFGAGVPTGSIDEQDVTPASNPDKVRLPYPMQLGSGTFDLLPGIAYLGQRDLWSWGAQTLGVLRLGENDNEYRAGHQFDATAWTARKISDVFSVSGRVLARTWGDIEGADPVQNPMMVPTASPDLRGGTRVDAGLGVNVSVPEGVLKGFRVAVEVLTPFYEDLDGPQLESSTYVIVGAQYAFKL
jgi:hypothetical protein